EAAGIVGLPVRSFRLVARAVSEAVGALVVVIDGLEQIDDLAPSDLPDLDAVPLAVVLGRLDVGNCDDMATGGLGAPAVNRGDDVRGLGLARSFPKQSGHDCARCLDGGAVPCPDGGAVPCLDGGAAPCPDGGAAPCPDGGAVPCLDGGAAPCPDGGAAPCPDGGAA